MLTPLHSRLSVSQQKLISQTGLQLEILYTGERIVGDSKNEEGGTLRLFLSFHLSLIAFPTVTHTQAEETERTRQG